MPRIKSSLSEGDKSLSTDTVTPVKVKTKPANHFCFICREYFFLPVEDFLLKGHYTFQAVKQIVEKSPYHDRVFRSCLKPAPKLVK